MNLPFPQTDMQRYFTATYLDGQCYGEGYLFTSGPYVHMNIICKLVYFFVFTESRQTLPLPLSAKLGRRRTQTGNSCVTNTFQGIAKKCLARRLRAKTHLKHRLYNGQIERLAPINTQVHGSSQIH